MGVSCISVYQDELLDVDNFLLEKGLLIHEPALTTEIVLHYLRTLNNRSPDSELLDKGKQAYFLFKQMILDRASNPTAVVA